MLSGCSDGGNESPENPNPTPTPSPEETAFITIDSSIITNGVAFEAKGGEKSVSFSANKDWTLSVATPINGTVWCTPSVTNGVKGDATVKFTVKENADYDDRSVSVTIKAGTASKTFTITQKGTDALLVTSTKFEVPQEGGSIEVEVKANISYELQISETAKSWISEAKSRALTTKKHTFTIAPSEEYEKREGEIHIKSGDKLEIVKVYQAGGAILMLSKNDCSVSSEGETISIDIKSNIEYGVQMPNVDWITDVSASRAASSHTLKYVVLPNETPDARSAEIIFYDKNSSLKDTLKVVQAQKDAIIISKKEYEVKAEGETIEVKLSANVDFEVIMPEVDWVSQVAARALTEQTLYFKVAENKNYDSRSAEIVIINNVSQLSEKIIVSQQKATFLKLTKDEYNVSDFGETISVEFKSNIEYGIQMPEVDWITASSSARSVSADTLKFVVSPNETYNARSAEIIFYDKNGSLKDTLKINQAQKNAIVLSKTEYTMPSEGGTLEFEIKSNVDFTTEISTDWIIQTTVSRGLESKQLYFTVDENLAEEGREGTITFMHGDLKQSIKVKQDGINIPYVTFTADALQTLTMSKAVETLEYSLKGGEWSELGTTTVTFGGDNGDLRLRGKSLYGTAKSRNDYSRIRFGTEVAVVCNGDIRTLVNYEEYNTVNTVNALFCFLFYKCENLTTAPKLPATILQSYCYYSMFKGCKNLIEAPELPAIRMAPYCYSEMFNGCTNLMTVPTLPSIDLDWNCYSKMFQNCVSLTKAPELPAETLAKSCYSWMFYGCTNLVEAPMLPAKMLIEYCYCEMFGYCEKLNKVTMLATCVDVPYGLTYWLGNVSSTGVLTIAAGMKSLLDEKKAIPDGWEVVEYEE